MKQDSFLLQFVLMKGLSMLLSETTPFCYIIVLADRIVEARL